MTNEIDWHAQIPLQKLHLEDENAALREALHAAVEKLWEMDQQADRQYHAIEELRRQLHTAAQLIRQLQDR